MNLVLHNQGKLSHLNNPKNLGVDSKWKIGLTTLEVYNSIFNITGEKAFPNFIQTFWISFQSQNWNMSLRRFMIFRIFHTSICRIKKAPHVIFAYKNLSSKKRHIDGYYMLLKGFDRSPFRGFESFVRFVVGWDKDAIKWHLKQ